VGENDGVFAADDFVEGDELLGADEGTGAVVNEDVRNIGREGGEGGGDGVLALASAADEDGGRGGVGGELHHLALVAVDDDIEIGDGALHEGGGGVGEDGAAGEGSEDFVGDGAGHARAAAGGEENGGGAGHGRWGELRAKR
jgi:hypothetical protein